MTERALGDRYRIVRELGRGGMGVVYLGRDLRLDMDVAIKFRGVTQHEATLWLKREFRTVAPLRHPNLVELYELVAHDKSCYFTMEYLDGADPRRWVERDGGSTAAYDEETRTVAPRGNEDTDAPTNPAPTHRSPGGIFSRPVPVVELTRVRAVLAQLAEGLAFLHARGVIHRDVKPTNVIVVDGTVKLLDFGLALEEHRRAEDLAKETRIVGTAAYLAPEYLEKLAVSPAMDVYSLGVLAFELVTGAPPFGGTLHVLSRLHDRIDIPRARDLNPDVSEELDALIAHMLAADPADRPSAREVADRLMGHASQPPVRAARRATGFVGRAVELAKLGTLIGDARPRARLALVTGPSGAGKTALIDEALHRARDGATVAWRGRCHERERVAYRAFDLIVDDLATHLEGDPSVAEGLEHAAALARVFPALAHVLGPRAHGTPAGDLRVERERALLAMTQLFQRALAAPRGVLAIDDLQWADDDSLELLALLVERAERRLTVIASWTTDGPIPPPLRALLDRLAERAPGRVTSIDLPLMSERELVEVIAERAPDAPAARVALAARLAAGSPYLAELIGTELLAGTEELDAPAETRRLSRLEPTERAVAQFTALVGPTATFEQLRALAQYPSGRLQSALRGLADARIVRAMPAANGDPVYGFYHQRLRDAAYSSIPASVRRTLHEHLAHWFERGSREPAALATHWRAANQPARAADYALLAGDAAHAQLAWGIAADWYEKSLAGVARGDDRERRAKLAEALFLGGKLQPAAEAFLALATTELQPDGANLAGDRWRVRAAEAYLKLGELERGLAVLDGVLERRGERRASSRTVSMLRAAGVTAKWLAPGTRAYRAAGDDVLAAAYRVIASFLSTPYPIESLEYVLRGVALADRTGDRAAHGMGLAMLSAYLGAGSLGRFGDRALHAADRLARGAPYPTMVASGCRGILAMLRGDWAGMRAAHEAAAATCARIGLERSWEASFLRSYRALGELYAGDPARALELLDELRDTADDLFGRALVGSYRGRALVLAGDLDAARAVAREQAKRPAAQQGVASIYQRVFLGELALAERDWDLAARIAAELATSARAQWLSAMPAISAMIDVVAATAELGRASAGNPSAAPRAALHARRLYRRGRASFYAATGLRLWAQAEALRGNRRRSEALLARALAAAPRAGAVDQLAIAALAGQPVEAGRLAPAVGWFTGGGVAL